MAQYLPILVMLILGIAFAGISLVMSRLASPKRPSEAKSAPYECGIVPRQEPPERFPVRRSGVLQMRCAVADVAVEDNERRSSLRPGKDV